MVRAGQRCLWTTKAEAEATQAKAEAETRAYVERVKAAEALEGHPALLRLAELETLRELAKNGNARLYLSGSLKFEE